MIRYRLLGALSLLLFALLADSGQGAVRDYLKQGKVVDSQVDQVTLYAQQAKIIRLLDLKVVKAEQGSTWVHIKEITGKIKKDSIRVRVIGGGKGRISQVVIEDLYDFAPYTPEVKSLKDKLLTLYGQKLDLIQQSQLAYKEMSFYDQLNYFPLPASIENFPSFTATPAILNSAMTKIGVIRKQQFSIVQKIKTKIEDNKQEIKLIQKRLQNYTDLRQAKWMTHLFVLVEHPSKWKSLQGKLEVSYLIKGASWKPVYDIRARLDRKRGKAKISLVTAGLVAQKSDELWKSVALSFSTTSPAPLFTRKLDRWIFQERRVEVKSKSRRDKSLGGFAGPPMGVMSESMEMEQTDSMMQKSNFMMQKKERVSTQRRGRKKMARARKAELARRRSAPTPSPREQVTRHRQESKVDFLPLASLAKIFPLLRQTEEKIYRLKRSKVQGRPYIGGDDSVVNYSSFPETKGRNITFKSPLRVMIEHHQAPVKIPIATSSLEAKLKYFAIPKRDKKVYLQAHTRNASNKPLLNGEAQIFMNGDLVGRTFLRNITENSSFSIDLGEDPNVETDRVVTKKSNSTGIIVKGHSTTVKVEISVSNHNRFPIRLALKDQYPLSPHRDLKIKLLQVSPQPSSTTKGVMSWKMIKIEGKGKQKINFSYQVEHPKDWIVSEFN
ncbi:MAG: mucoidy inhibitor MuiA family protein [Bdellovibrionales bacterium]|nr:mucoidy inhibitor MuiA family protein [Bdellovibrionales bacterium]